MRYLINNNLIKKIFNPGMQLFDNHLFVIYYFVTLLL